MNILYLSCHATLEHEEVNILRKLGHNVFTIGHYTDNIDITRNNIEKNDPELMLEYKSFHPNHKGGMPIKLNSSFLRHFDTIISSYWYENILWNWEAVRSKRIIYRSIGLHSPGREEYFIPYKQHGLKILRMSPKERELPSYCGEDAIIRASVNPDYFNKWKGNESNILTIQKYIRKSSIERMWLEYNAVTNSFKNNRVLCGKLNEDIPYALTDIKEDDLQTLRRKSRVYFSLTTRCAVATYTFVEAMMTGMPVVTVDKRLAGYNWFENPDFIENGVNGFKSNSVEEIKFYLSSLLKDTKLAKSISVEARKTMLQHFDPKVIEPQWKTFMDSL